MVLGWSAGSFLILSYQHVTDLRCYRAAGLFMARLVPMAKAHRRVFEAMEEDVTGLGI